MVQATTVLKKWGNSQGVRIPREACGMLGIDVGARADVAIDPVASTVTMKFEHTRPERRYSRHRRMSLEEIVSERGGTWDGMKAHGEEITGSVGAEVAE